MNEIARILGVAAATTHEVSGSYGHHLITGDGTILQSWAYTDKGREFETDRGRYGDGDGSTVILRFDMAEYERFYGRTWESIDICDIGYWTIVDGVEVYEPALPDYRERAMARQLSQIPGEHL